MNHDRDMTVVRLFHGAVASGDWSGVEGLLHHDVELFGPAGHPLSGHVRGADVVTESLATYARATGMTETGAMTLTGLFASTKGDVVGVRSQQGAGSSVESVQAALFELSGGRITRIEMFIDDLTSDPDAVSVIDDLYAAFDRGDLSAFESCLDQDMVLFLPGEHSLGGWFHGAASVGANLKATAAVVSYTVTREEIFVGRGGRVLVKEMTHATRNAYSIAAPEAILFTVADGRIAGMLEMYGDPAMTARLWA